MEGPLVGRKEATSKQIGGEKANFSLGYRYDMRLFSTVDEIAHELRIKLPNDLPKDCLSLRVLTNQRLSNTLGRFRRHYRDGQTVAWIELSAELSKDPNIYRIVFLHELAHAWAYFAGYPNAKHNGVWKYFASRLGIVPNRLIYAPHLGKNKANRESKVVGKCAKCGFEIVRRRKLPINKTYTHNNCGGMILSVT